MFGWASIYGANTLILKMKNISILLFIWHIITYTFYNTIASKQAPCLFEWWWYCCCCCFWHTFIRETAGRSAVHSVANIIHTQSALLSFRKLPAYPPLLLLDSFCVEWPPLTKINLFQICSDRFFFAPICLNANANDGAAARLSALKYSLSLLLLRLLFSFYFFVWVQQWQYYLLRSVIFNAVLEIQVQKEGIEIKNFKMRRRWWWGKRESRPIWGGKKNSGERHGTRHGMARVEKRNELLFKINFSIRTDMKRKKAVRHRTVHVSARPPLPI